MPDWWLTASGVFFILGSVAMLVTVVLLAVLGYAALELRTGVQELSKKIDAITTKVDDIATNLKHVTSEVSTRTTGMVRMIDDAAGGAMTIVEKFAPVLVGVAAVGRIFMQFGRRRR